MPHNLAQVEIRQSSTVTVLPLGGHDLRRDLRGAGLFGLAGAAGFGGVITPDALIAIRELVVAVGAQGNPVGAGMARPARAADLTGRQLFGGAASRLGGLTR